MKRYESRLAYTAQLVEWFDDPGIVFVVNMSGGKDSTALRLWFIEHKIPHRAVFADTQWEAPETYAYLDLLREKTGPIDVVGRLGGMLAVADHKAGFPSRRGRWCTEMLKIEPLRVYYDAIEATGKEAVCVVGLRAEESEARAAMPMVEFEDRWGGWMWRPGMWWTVEEVIARHHRHGIPLNPLYLRGHNRVGCHPCIMEDKEGVRLTAKHAPERIDVIRGRERAYSIERRRRNSTGEGNFAHERATFFMAKLPGVNTIDEVVAWSRTERGGRQLPMFAAPPDGGCFRWGLCEPPAADPDGAVDEISTAP